MCLAVYIASDAELPLIPFVKGSSAIFTQAVPRDCLPSYVRRPHVMYVGASGGCGCGFLTDGVGPLSSAAVKTTRALSSFAQYTAAAARASDLNVIACWMGDEDDEPIRAGDVIPDFFCFDNDPFKAAWDAPIQYFVRRIFAAPPKA